MQRLTELRSSFDPALSRANALLSTMPRLETTEPPALTATAPRRGARWIRPGTFALLGACSLALASLGRPLGDPPRRALTEPAVAPVALAPAAGALGPRPTPPETPSFDVAPGDSTAIVTQRPAPRGHSIDLPTPARPKFALRSSPPPDPVRQGSAPALSGPGIDEGDESALMLAAVRALRRDGDAESARTLAEESLRRYPNGVQIEEAMELALEAALVHEGATGARPAAAAQRRYLEAFPAGRFVDRARRILTIISQ